MVASLVNPLSLFSLQIVREDTPGMFYMPLGSDACLNTKMLVYNTMYLQRISYSACS